MNARHRLIACGISTDGRYALPPVAVMPIVTLARRAILSCSPRYSTVEVRAAPGCLVRARAGCGLTEGSIRGRIVPRMVGRSEKTFRANQGRTWIATVGIASVIVLKPLVAALLAVEHFWMSDWEYSEETSALILGGVFGSAGLALMLANLVAIVGFLLWFHRTIANAEALGRGLRRVSPGAAVLFGSFRFSNLFRPYHVVTAL